MGIIKILMSVQRFIKNTVTTVSTRIYPMVMYSKSRLWEQKELCTIKNNTAKRMKTLNKLYTTPSIKRGKYNETLFPKKVYIYP